MSSQRASAQVTAQAVVVDTCVVSYDFKKSDLRKLYVPHIVGKRLIISPMTLAELWRCALAHNWGAARRHAMEQYLRRYAVEPFSRVRIPLIWPVHSTIKWPLQSRGV